MPTRSCATWRGVRADSVSDRTFLMDKGGKIEVTSKLPLTTRDDLSMAYTPGVARVSMAIHEDSGQGWALTIKSNTVAVVSDGTAVPGMGDTGGRQRRWKCCAEHGSRPPSPSRTLARFVESSGRQRQLRLDCLPERVEQRERHTRSAERPSRPPLCGNAKVHEDSPTPSAAAPTRRDESTSGPRLSRGRRRRVRRGCRSPFGTLGAAINGRRGR